MTLPFVGLRKVMGAAVLFAAGCSAEHPSAQPAQAVDTYRLDLSRFDQGRPATFRNESLAFSVDLTSPTQVLTGPSRERFAIVYNRLGCQLPQTTAANDEMAAWAFGRLADVTPRQSVRLESVSLEMPDDDTWGRQVQEVCFAYRTQDGIWHGHFEPIPTVHDDVRRSSSVTIHVGAEHVDIMGVVIFEGAVSSISYVATAE